MPLPDWSEVAWYVYESPAGVRVLPRKLSGRLRGHAYEHYSAAQCRGELRTNEKLAAVVPGVSRKAVLHLLKSGVKPGDLLAHISRAEEAQYARSADDRRPNAYREWIDKLERQKRELHERRQAA